MTDIQKLKALAEAANQQSDGASWAYEPHGDTGEFGVGVLEDDQGNSVTGRQSSGEMLVLESVAPEVSCEAYAAFIAAANPAAVLGLIAELEAERQRRWDGNESSSNEHAEEVRKLKAINFDYELHSSAAIEEIAQLKAENEALRKDAERYRWLRSRDSSDDPELNVVRWARQSSTSATGESPRLEELDSAIDAAMGKEASHD